MTWTKPSTVNTILYSKPSLVQGVLTLYDDASVLYDSATQLYDGLFSTNLPMSTIWSKPSTINTSVWTKPVVINTV